MLTFYFDGVSGEMQEEEILTAGMVSKEIQFRFSEDWDGLRKVVVYQAGELSCTVVDVQAQTVIPPVVLSASLRRLYVGVYGMSEDGLVVIPTIYARGPFIRIGTNEGEEGSGYDPQDPFWLRVEEAVEKSLWFAPQTLTEAQQYQARLNIGAARDSRTAVTALLTVLQNGVYLTNQNENIAKLRQELLNYKVPEE